MKYYHPLGENEPTGKYSPLTISSIKNRLFEFIDLDDYNKLEDQVHILSRAICNLLDWDEEKFVYIYTIIEYQKFSKLYSQFVNNLKYTNRVNFYKINDRTDHSLNNEAKELVEQYKKYGKFALGA